MLGSMTTILRQLRLSGLASTLEVRLQEATANRLSHQEFLGLLLQDELTVRKNRLIARRLKTGGFKEQKTLDEFDWTFNSGIKNREIFELSTGKFIQDAQDVLFIGPPGVGKTHLAQAIGQQAIRLGYTALYRSIFDITREFLQNETMMGEDKVMTSYLKTDLLIIDDMGMRQLPKHSGEFLLEVIERRHENRSTIMTSNRPIEEWGKFIGDVPVTTAILDRFLQNAQIITLSGRSYRLRNKAGKKGE